MKLIEISEKQFLEEPEAIATLTDYLGRDNSNYQTIYNHAYKMVENLRNSELGFSVEAFLDTYNLSTKEGVAIMCLAEALLRIPDKETADKLIESTFEDAHWDKYVGSNDSFYINAASWGMLMTGKTVEFAFDEKEKPLHGLRKIVKRASEPVIRNALRSAMKLIATQFVLGEDIDSALKKARKFQNKGYMFSYDILGEGARTQEQADRYFSSYKAAITRVASEQDSKKDIYEKAGISIKLTALHPRYELLHKERVIEELLPKVVELIQIAKQANLAIAIDAEEARRLDIELEVYTAIRSMPEFADYNGIGFVLQAYQKRAFYVIDYLIELAEKSRCVIPIRLVKGAYWDSEIKYAQEQGLEQFPVFTNKFHSDVSYLACAKKILNNHKHFFPQFATHNAHTISAIIEYAGDKKFEFQRLYGMSEKLYEDIVKTIPCRIYAPIGEHKDLLAYLIRRLLENGANSSFLNIVIDKNIPIPKVIQNPILRTKELGGKPNATLPLPTELYGISRQNSKGFDLGNLKHIEELRNGIGSVKSDIKIPDRIEKIDVALMVDKSSSAFENWKQFNVKDRADILRKAADLLENNSFEIISILMKEGGKVLKDTISELREAVDYCRFYAAEAERLMSKPQSLPGITGESNSLSLHPHGVFACISPWNFPLAIFMGQVAAALVTGNTVLAKPAEQTPIIAAKAVSILHEAGIPKDALQLLIGKGSIIGSELIKHPDLKGVCFTGSTSTAKHIQRSLANDHEAIIPLIAETGGQNCMIADSSTLPEQLCDDVLNSAFNSAGQRCSALRVLFLPEAIANECLHLFSNALHELKIGDPKDFTTDIGPVIDKNAKQALEQHVEELSKSNKAKLVVEASVPDEGNFFPPQIWEIENIEMLTKEHFGPILHVIRYQDSDLDKIYEQINSLKFGLTFGMHTRIAKQYYGIDDKVNAGNIYVNRNITGAVVGSQPFGGEGLSGTGFKAGGPHYLLRFLTERTITINTAAIGGNIDLLMKS